MQSPANEKNFPIVWMDLEMTGLDPEADTILEVATIITDTQLNIIAEGPQLIIQHNAERFAKMDEWNQKQHTKSGLWKKAVESKISLQDAEQQTLDFIKRHVPEKKGILAGNSIWQDRRFIIKYMPILDNYLYYRMIDVSTIKTLANYWYPALNFEKSGSHRALDDIKESIAELKFYKTHMLRENLA